MSQKYKNMMLFMLIALVPIIIIAFYYDQVTHEIVTENVRLFSNKIVQQTRSGLDDRIYNMETNLHMSVNNQDVLDMMLELPKDDPIEATFKEVKLGKHFNTIIYNLPYLETIVIDLYDYKTLMFGEGIEQGQISQAIKNVISQEFKREAPYSRAQSSENKPIWILGESQEDDSIYLIKEFKYFMYAKTMGVVTFIIDKGMINDYIESESLLQDGQYMVLNEENIDMNTKEYSEVYDELLKRVMQVDDVITGEYRQELISYTELNNGWQLINKIPEKIVFKDLRKTRSNTFIFALGGVIISIISAWIISKSTGNKLDKLIKKFEKVEKGDFTTEVVIDSGDEFAEIEHHFNKMVKELDNLIKENYLCSLETKEAHLKALQYQINPHFLYNILEIINAIAATYKAKEIRKITQNLGSLFRYNITGLTGEVTQLRHEIEHIKTYIYLQQVQLPYKLEVFFDIEEAINRVKILKFTLQPIIENIIKHGFEDRCGSASIEINAVVEDRLIITIADDGSGMSEDILIKLQERLEQRQINIKREDGVGIGLKNIQERIKLTYGEDYGITIKSVLNQGTMIIVTFPYIE